MSYGYSVIITSLLRIYLNQLNLNSPEIYFLRSCGILKKNFNSFSFSGGINIRQSFKRRLSWCLWIKNCVALRHNILQRDTAYTSRSYNRGCGIEDVLTTKRLKWNLPTPKASQSSIFLFTRSGTRNPRTDGLRMLL